MTVSSEQSAVSSKHKRTDHASRILVLLCLLPAFFLPAGSVAQQPKKIPRIGYLSGAGDPSNPGPNVEAFRRGLQELGYIEGKNILLEYRYIEGKRDRVQVWWRNSYGAQPWFPVGFLIQFSSSCDGRQTVGAFGGMPS